MDSTFGTRLKSQREGRQIPLSAIAEKTKIKMSLLEGLERDDVSRWPSGIFRRSYLRAYAAAIGLEPDRLLKEFQTLHPDPEFVEDVTATLAQARQLAERRRPPTRLRCLIDSAVNALPQLQQSFRSAPEPARAESPEPVQPSFAMAPSPPEPLPPPDELSGVELHEPAAVDFAALAHLCTRLARALDVCDVRPVLEEAADVLRAVGVTLWVTNQVGRELEPVFVHGYSDEIAAQLRPVSRESENAIARAFRTAEARVVDAGEAATGAVVVPLVTPTGCAGVLALELRHGGERLECVRAAATILAAQLSTMCGVPSLAEAVGA